MVAETQALFDEYDFLALPTAQVFPFPKEIHWPESINGVEMDTYHRWMEVVIGGTLAGIPVVVQVVNASNSSKLGRKVLESTLGIHRDAPGSREASGEPGEFRRSCSRDVRSPGCRPEGPRIGVGHDDRRIRRAAGSAPRPTWSIG